MKIYTKFLDKNPYFRDGKWITGKSFAGFFLHSTATSQPDPMVFVNRWNSPNYTAAGISGFIGADAVYLTASCLDTPGSVKRMPHAGVGTTNNSYIGFEMCEPAGLHYNDSHSRILSCDNFEAGRDYVLKTYRNAVELFAKLCEFHGKDPLQLKTIVSHKEGHELGIATNHGDPDHLWKFFAPELNMDKFRADVAAEMHKKEETEVRYQTVGDMKREAQAEKYYLPTVEKLISKGILAGKGGSGDALVLDFSEDSVRLLVILDRAGAFGE